MTVTFVQAGDNQPFARVGIFGFQGAGKTYMSALIAIGLLQRHEKKTGEKKLAMIFDTETASDQIAPLFKEAGYELLSFKSRAFADLSEAFDVAKQRGCYVFMIDSLTHIWDETQDAYMDAKKRDWIDMHEWKAIKKKWRKQYIDKFHAADFHVIVASRAGWQYEDMIGDDGKKDMFKSGTQMRAGDFGFEPELIIEMMLEPVIRATKQRPSKGGVVYKFVCVVTKDRKDLHGEGLMGKRFENPTFETFLPHFKKLEAAGKHISTDTSRSSKDMFEDGGAERYRKKRSREALIEMIETALVKEQISGNVGKEEKAFRVFLLEAIFGNGTGAVIKDMNLDDLGDGVELLEFCIHAACERFRVDPKFDVKTFVAEQKYVLDQQKKADQGIIDNSDDFDESKFTGAEAPATGDSQGIAASLRSSQ